MCGILATNHPAVEREAFARAVNLMTHRGPDASGLLSEGPVHLGHRRLKIVDLDDRSNQPFTSACGRYVIVFNGEIYNFRELAGRYDLQLHTAGDTEVLLELFARKGPAILPELYGMWAFVIWDRQAQSLFAARDRLGVKPLYYMQREGACSLASEVAPLLALHGASRPDIFALRQFLKMRGCFNGRTIWQDIRMLPAGHYMENGRLVRYWSLPPGTQPPPEDDELRTLVEQAVERRLVADVPVGSYLSGGLDSTIVAGLAGKPHTWTVGFTESNEFPWARMAADTFHSTHHEVLVEREEFLATAKDMIRHRREPLAVPNEVLLCLMTRAVKKENTVVLSGEGADELFLGYDRIFRWAAHAQEWNLEDFASHYAYSGHSDPEVIADAMAPFLTPGATVLESVAAFFQVAHLHALLRRVDNSTMDASVEARVPFVDHTLVERMAGTPFDWRMAGGIAKAPLKRVFSHLVPHGIIDRPKIGFPVPLKALGFGGRVVAGRALSPMEDWLWWNLELHTDSALEWGDLGLPPP